MPASCPCGEPLPDTRTICSRCEQQVRYHLRDQEGHRQELLVALTRQVRMNAPNDGSRSANPALLWRRMGDRYLDTIEPDEVRRIIASLPPARAAANALHVQRALLVRWCKLLPGRPRSATVAHMAEHIESQLPRVHVHKAAPELVSGLRDLASQVLRVIDTPVNRLRIQVGPCPEHECDGTIEATVPHDAPPMMRCPVCKAEWNSTQWTRVGARIHAVVQRQGRSPSSPGTRANAEESSSRGPATLTSAQPSENVRVVVGC